MIKKLLPSKDVYIQFTEDELLELNIAPNDKFTMEPLEDGSIKLTKFATLELDLEEFPIEVLHNLIRVSCEEDISVNEVINNSLRRALNLEDDAS